MIITTEYKDNKRPSFVLETGVNSVETQVGDGIIALTSESTEKLKNRRLKLKQFVDLDRLEKLDLEKINFKENYIFNKPFVYGEEIEKLPFNLEDYVFSDGEYDLNTLRKRIYEYKKMRREERASVIDFFLNLEFKLRNLKVMYNTEIRDMKIEDSVLTSLVETDSERDYPVIYYNFFSSDAFVEKVVLDSSFIEGIKSGEVKFNYSENDTYKANKAFEKQKSFLIDDAKRINAISYFNMLLGRYFGYKYKIERIEENTNTKQFHIKASYNNFPLENIEDIQDDNAFLCFKFFEYLLNINKHFGVFFIDCMSLNNNVLECILYLIRSVFLSNSHVFLYNAPKNISELDDRLRVRVYELPNHMEGKETSQYFNTDIQGRPKTHSTTEDGLIKDTGKKKSHKKK